MLRPRLGLGGTRVRRGRKFKRDSWPLVQGGSALSYFQIVNFLVYGIAGRFGAPLFAVNNLIGRFADNLFRNDLFCLNFAILARKPA